MLKKLFETIDTKSVRWRWIMSYFVIICIFVCFAITSVSMFFFIHKTELVRANEYIANMIEEQYEYILMDMQSVAYGVESESVRKLLLQSDKSEFDRAERFSLIQKELKKLLGNSDFFEECFLYLGEYDTVINSTSVLNSSLYYDAYVSDCDISYKEWKRVVTSDTKGCFLEILEKDGKKRFVYTYKNSLSLMLDRDDTSISFVLDRNKIKQINDRVYSACGGYICIANSNNLVANISDNGAMRSFNPKKMYKKGEIDYAVVNGIEYVVLSPENQVGNRIFIIIPESIFYKNLIGIVLVQVIMLIIIAAVMIFLAIKFSNRHFQPIKSIINSFNKEIGVDKRNEYDIITDIVHHAQSEKYRINNKMTKQTMFLRNNFIQRLVKGEYDSITLLRDNLKHYGVEFKTGSFVVLVLTPNNFGELWMSYAESDDHYKMALTALENIISELVGKRYICYTVNIDEEIVCVVNAEGFVEEDELKHDLNEIYSYAGNFIHCNLGFDFEMTVGKIKKSISEIHLSYNEAINCNEYNFIYDKSIVFADDAAALNNDRLNTLFLKTNLIAKEMLRTEKSAELDKEITQLCKMCISLATSMPNLVNSVMHGFKNHLIRQLLLLNEEDEKIQQFAELIAEKYSFDGIRSFLDMKESMLDISKKIECFLSEYRSTDYLKERVISYIRKNYQDPDLSVGGIAEHFNLNTAYLSSTFKKSAKIGLLEMINKVRCEKSIDLLINSKKSINDIAADIGCTNAHAYIRIFKKYYFCTPTEYRNNFKKE